MFSNYFKVLFTLLFLSFISVNAELVVARKDNPTKNDINLFIEKGYDVAASRVGKFVDVIISEEEFQKIHSIYDLKIIDTESKMNERAFCSSTDRQSDVGYMTYSTYVSKLEELEQQYSDIMKVYDVGDSEGKSQNINGYNHDIWMIKISDNVEEEEAEPGYMFIGEHHARETQTFPVTYAILKYLVTNYSSDTKVAQYVNSNQIYLVPLLNPNGYTVARTKNSNWRKNINLNGTTFNPNYSFGNGSSVGVDLNRNYEFHWGEGSSSPNKTAETYRGPNPLSENESTVMDSLMSVLNVQASISFHSYSEVILVPFSYSQWTKPSDYNELVALANDMAKEMKDSWGRAYEVGNAEGLLGYGAGGGMSDHMYANYGVFAYCFELWTSFQTPESSLPSLSSMSVNAAKVMMDRSTFSTLKGVVTLNGEPAVAKIELSDVDDNVGQRTDYYSHESTGFYTRFLPDGEYTLTVTLDSEPDSVRVIDGVVINSNSVTIQDVEFGQVIEPDTLLITSPSSGDIFEQGKVCAINWHNRNRADDIPCEFVDLDLYRDNSFVIKIADSIENVGYYNWTIIEALGSDTIDTTFSIKVSSANDSTIYDFSEDFTIYSDVTANQSIETNIRSSLGIQNISSNSLCISVADKGTYNIKLYAINGKVVNEWSGELSSGNHNVKLKNSMLSSQLLLVKIYGSMNNLTEKVIVK